MLRGCPDLCLNDVPGEDSEGVVTEISLLHHLPAQPANKHTQINLLHKQQTSISLVMEVVLMEEVVMV